MAPPELKSIHPLGKSPVLEDDDEVVIESGAITEYLIDKYGDGRFAPQRGTKAYTQYIQWMHFAESSAMVPLLLKMFVAKDGAPTNFLADYADAETMKVMGYVEECLEGKLYLVEDRLTGADFMMSFVVDVLNKFGVIERFPNIQRYGAQLASHPSFVKAEALEVKYG